MVVGVLGEDGADKRGARHDQAAEQREIGLCTARPRRWARNPETAATNTCTIVTAATVLTSSRPTPSTGGPYSSSGSMTMAPPTPTRPDDEVRRRSSGRAGRTERRRSRRVRSGGTTAATSGSSSTPRRPRASRRESTSETDFSCVSASIARAALVRLEQQQLVADVAGRLAGDGRHELGARRPGLRGRGTPRTGRRRRGLARRPPGPACRATGSRFCAAKNVAISSTPRSFTCLANGSISGDGRLAGRVVFDRLLEVRDVHAGQDRHRLRPAVASAP